MSVLNPGGKDIVDRPEKDYPPARTQYQKLHLNAANHTMAPELVSTESADTYNSDNKDGKAFYRYRMSRDTEIGGFIKLRLWVEAPDHDDMDLEVTLEKLNRFGRKIGLNPMQRVSAKGYIRASMRELDAEHSREEYPLQSFKVSRKLKEGEIVPLDIAIWPMGMYFRKGEYLQITINAYKTTGWESPFDLKMATIQVPKEGYTYLPGEKPEMITIGGVSGGLTGGIDMTNLPKDVNKGRHMIHTGGKFDSYLYLPVIPEED